MENRELAIKANEIRKGIIEEVYSGQSGHPGGSLSCAELFALLYEEEMNIDPQNPADPDRDRFVLSKGHCCPGLYAAMAVRGYFPIDELKTFRKLGSRLQGHPSMHWLPGVDISSGSLGQGISAAVGIAEGAKLQKKDFRVYTLLGDGEIQEGQVWEAAMFASAKKLDNLILVIDYNNLQIDGTLAEVNSPEPIDAKFEAFGFEVFCIDGHDFDQIRDAFAKAKEANGRPKAIIAKTVKGKGVSFMENVCGWHGKATNDAEYEVAKADLERLGATL